MSPGPIRFGHQATVSSADGPGSRLCPGVSGIHLNAENTVSMTAALLCGAGASPVHKVSRITAAPECSADHGQIEDHAHAQNMLWRGCYG